MQPVPDAPESPFSVISLLPLAGQKSFSKPEDIKARNHQ